MGLAQRFLTPRSGRATLSNPPPWLLSAFGGNPTAAGTRVSPDTAERFSPVFRAVELIASTLATVPLAVLRRSPDGDEPDSAHPLTVTLRDRPNHWMTSASWRKLMARQVELWGNAYSRITLNGDGSIAELLPLHPSRVRPKWVQALGTVIYEYQPPDGALEILLRGEIHHRMGPSQNGLEGMSRVTLARESIGAGLAMEEYTSRLFSNSARPAGLVKIPAPFRDDTERKNFKASWAREYEGAANSGKTMITDGGIEWVPLGMSSKDAEFLLTRTFTILEIARWFGLNPNKLMDLTHATFSNIEEQNIEFVTDTIAPRAVEWQQELVRDLLSETAQRTHKIEFMLQGLLRGDVGRRGNWYALGRQWGWFSINDILQFENQKTIGPEGDIHMAPLNMVDVATLIDQPAANPDPNAQPGGGPGNSGRVTLDLTDAGKRTREARARRSVEARLRLRQAHKRLFCDAAARMHRKEAGVIRGALKKIGGKRGLEGALTELSAYYGLEPDQRGEHLRYFGLVLKPGLLTFAESVLAELSGDLGRADLTLAEFEREIEGFAGRMARDHGQASLAALRKVFEVHAADPSPYIEEVLDIWEAQRCDALAAREVVRFESWLTRQVCDRLAIAATWVARSDGCEAFNGARAEPGQPFSAATQASNAVHHPPSAEGCTCILSIGG